MKTKKRKKLCVGIRRLSATLRRSFLIRFLGVTDDTSLWRMSLPTVESSSPKRRKHSNKESLRSNESLKPKTKFGSVHILKKHCSNLPIIVGTPVKIDPGMSVTTPWKTSIGLSLKNLGGSVLTVQRLSSPNWL